jgi:PAS domain S-box-containing protein
MPQEEKRSLNKKESMENLDRLPAGTRSKRGQTANKLKIRQLSQLVHELNSYRLAIDTQSETMLSSQKQLSLSKHKYHTLFDLAPFSYMVLSKIGLIEDVNRAAARMFGISRAELINKPFLQFTAPESKDIFHDHVRKVLKTKLKHTCKLKLFNGKQESVYVELATSYTKQKQNNTVYLMTALIDITRQNEADKNLTHYSSRLEDMVKKLTGELREAKKAQ